MKIKVNKKMINTFDWNEVAQAKKVAKTSDQTFCGNVIAEYQDYSGIWGKTTWIYDPKK